MAKNSLLIPPPERRLELLREYLKPLAAAIITTSLFAWTVGAPVDPRRPIGLSLMAYAMLSIHRNALACEVEDAPDSIP